MSKFNSAEFKALKARWYAKVKKSGFVDIETKSGELINASTSGGAIDPRQLNWRENEEFFRLARHFLNDYKFKTTHERYLWELYAEHGSMRKASEIAAKDRRRKKTDRDTVWKILDALRTEMFKMYGVSK